MSNGATKRVVIMISGSGSNMEALIRASHEPDYPARIVGVISDRPGSGGLARAEALNIPTLTLKRATYASREAHEADMLASLASLAPDIICLAGYMRILSPAFVTAFSGRIINIHPSLLPLFPGLNTHQRALDAGMKLAGCSVHVVNEGIDEGPVLAQAAVPILNGDTAEQLARRVLTAEHRLYPAALARFAGATGPMTDPAAVITSLG